MSEINNIESTQDNTAINDLPVAATGSMDNALSPIYLAAYPQQDLSRGYELQHSGPAFSEIAAESIEGPVQVSSVGETQEPAYVESDERYLEKYTKQYIKQLEEARKHFKKDSPDGEAEIGKVVIRYKSKDEKSDLEKPADFKIGPDGKLLKLSDKKAGLDEDLIVEVEVDDSASREVREAAAQQAGVIRAAIARVVSEQASQHIPIEIPAELQSQLSAAENVSAPAPQVIVRRGGDRGGYTSAPVSRGFGGGGLAGFFNSFRPSKIGQSFHNGISRIGHGIEKAISHVPGMGGLTHTKLNNTKVVANVAEHIAKDTGIKDSKQFTRLAVAMMLVESKGDNRAVGDHGTSFGLFQLHKGGMLTTAGLSKEQAMNPETNAKVALSNLAKVVKDGNYSSLGEAAAKSQRPANPQEYARRVNACLDQADNLIALADKPLNFAKGEQLARSAELVAGNKRPGGYCGLGTSDSVYNAGFGRYRGNANDLFDKLLASGKFIEIPVDNAPRGAVVFRPWSIATQQRKHEDHGDIAVLLDSNTRKAANDGIVNVARTNKGYYDDSKARAIFPV